MVVKDNAGSNVSSESVTHRNAANRKMFRTMVFGAVFRRKLRAMMAVIASIIGAATLFCLATICIEVPAQINEQMRAFGANLVVMPSGKNAVASGFSPQQVCAIVDKVASVAPEKYATYRYETVRIHNAPYILAGINVPEVQALNKHWTIQGSWPTHDDEVLLGHDIASAIGAVPGVSVKIGYRSGDNVAQAERDKATAEQQSAETFQNHQANNTQHIANSDDGRVQSTILDSSGKEYKVAGIVETGSEEDDIVYASNALVRHLSGISRGTDVIEFSSGALGDSLTHLVTDLNNDHFTLSAHSSSQKNEQKFSVVARQVSKITTADTRIITMLQTLFWLISCVVLVLTLVGVSTTMSSIVSQRKNEIGLCKALGATHRHIAREFYTEAACYGVAGGVIGTVLGFVFAQQLCIHVFQREISFNVLLALSSVLLAVAVAVVAAYFPIRNTSKIDPAVVLREE